jgi:hypothetical protein
MTKAVKSDLKKVLKIIVKTVEKRLAHLPVKEAAVLRKEIRRIASDTASLGSEKVSRPARTRVQRVPGRSRAKVS